MDRIRVASLQYFIRPLKTVEQFYEQVTGLVDTAADYKCRLLVFPEYFTTQLLTLGDVQRPIREQIRDLARHQEHFITEMSQLSKKRGLYIIGGTIPVCSPDDNKVRNESYIFSPKGEVGMQGKLHMTRFEKEEWDVHPHHEIKVFNTDFGVLGINICYDVEFPEIARTMAQQGANIIIVPSCTDDRQGYLRVRYCAQARAIENQLYVIHSGTVGSLPMVPAVSLNYGQASILTPNDFAFARDGILAEGMPNQESMVIGELNLRTIEDSRSHGTVLPLLDSKRTQELIKKIEVINI